MMKTISALTTAMVLAALPMAFAQAPSSEPLPALEPAPVQEMMAPPVHEATPSESMGEEKKLDRSKGSKGEQGKGKAKGHAKKVSKKRGLDRADQAAGQHGKQGREKARANQASR